MIKISAFTLLITIFAHDAFGQTTESNYSVFINLATSPGLLGFNGRFYRLSGDSLLIMDRIDQKRINDSTYIDIYDSTYYQITNVEKQKIFTTVKAIDSLESIFNSCMMDGLRFYFSCTLDSVEHSAWVSNAYDSRIFLFVDIINAHAPKDIQIRYDKDWLIREKKKCLKERYEVEN